MAFEAYLTQDTAKPKKKRRLTHAISLGLHGALLIVGVVYSFWHVEELSPPSVTVTFLSAAPPPPPPPPPPKKKTSSTKTKTKTEIRTPRTTDIVQPTDKKEEPKEEPEEADDGEEGGVEGGVAGGVVGGVVGGTLGGTATSSEPSKIVAPNVGSGQLAIDPGRAPYKVELPPALNRQGYQSFAMVKVCVDVSGSVKSANIVKGADPLVDPQITQKISTWRYKPYQINGRPQPFCYMLRYVIRAE